MPYCTNQKEKHQNRRAFFHYNTQGSDTYHTSFSQVLVARTLSLSTHYVFPLTVHHSKNRSRRSLQCSCGPIPSFTIFYCCRIYPAISSLFPFSSFPLLVCPRNIALSDGALCTLCST
jgi:hypothetical protein